MTDRSITCIPRDTELEVVMIDGLFSAPDAHMFRPDAKSFEEVSEQLEFLVIRARKGMLRWNRDVKRVKLFEDELLFELRLTVGEFDRVVGLRLLFLEDRDLQVLTFIGLHIKLPELEPSAQRLAQSADFRRFYGRYLEVADDNFNPSV